MEFRILGPLEVEAGGRLLGIGGAKQRALLALLLLNANRVVARERLIDALWGERPPETAHTALQVYVSNLRKTLGRDVIATQPPGYLIQVPEGALDLERFEQLVAEAQQAEPAAAEDSLRAALALWRGAPLADLDAAPFADGERRRLDELRLIALENRIDAGLALGRHRELVGELEALVHEQPLRERLRGQLMRALYGSGRQAEALEAYRDARRLLSEELGLEPGDALKQLERAILEQDPALTPAPPPAPVVGAPRRGRPRLAIGVGAVLLAGAAVAVAVSLIRGGHAALAIAANSVVAVDAKTGRVTGDTLLGGRPVAIAVGAGGVWVANADADTVSRIDPATHALETPIGLGVDVSGLAIGFGSVWVAGGNDGVLIRIDPRQDAVQAKLDVGGRTALGPQPVFLVATGSRSVWFSRGREVAELDPATGRVTASIRLNRNASGLTVGGDTVWVTTSDERLVRIDARTATITSAVQLTDLAFDPFVDHGTLWLGEAVQGGQVWQVDAATLTPTATATVPTPVGLAEAGGSLWVASHFDRTLFRLDRDSARVLRVLSLPYYPISVAAGAGTVWIGVQRDSFK